MTVVARRPVHPSDFRPSFSCVVCPIVRTLAERNAVWVMSALLFRHTSVRRSFHDLGLAAGVTLLSIIASSCAQTSAQPAAPMLPMVTVAAAVAREITEWDEFTGRLEAVNTVEVRPRVSGYVSHVHFREGALVRKGDLLFQIDPRPFQAEVDRLRAELERARSTGKRAQSELDRARRLAAENAMASEEVERRVSFAEEVVAQVAGVEAALRAAELNLEFTRVIAPISGRVGRAIITEGNLVSSGPGEGTLLATVVSIDPMYAAFDADEPTFLAQAGQNGPHGRAVPVRMALADDDKFAREGRLHFLDNQLDPATGTIRIRAIFDNRDGVLTPGLFVRLRMPGRRAYKAVLIEDRAVGTDLDKRYVYTVDGQGVVVPRPVTLGPIVEGLRVVRSGVTAGDSVIVNGLQRVRPGVRVQVGQATAGETQ
ncbi:Acriflavine resistance protein A precursor [Luteitalea pratensis]|uniref:Acriflavine resistance protein A n=2 Tax=Luteitalea pratensis TaxID=1855912 RepID=A0A143PGA7_LUTPR|nr:Acriflavine resistance protein A precursor [Luteitalea pratensis]